MKTGIEKIEIVPAPPGKNRKRGPYWRCKCLRCGRTDYITTTGDLNTGRIKSCGCYRDSEEFADSQVVHGHSRTSKGKKRSRTWTIWAGMRKRCDNPTAENWKYYGGRGISYSPLWNDFRRFLLDMGECPEGLELDRIDNNGNYEPGNCQWITHLENCQK